jgi:hypothetical protein
MAISPVRTDFGDISRGSNGGGSQLRPLPTSSSFVEDETQQYRSSSVLNVWINMAFRAEDGQV